MSARMILDSFPMLAVMHNSNNAELAMASPPLRAIDLLGDVHLAATTDARCWTLSAEKVIDEPLGQGDVAAKCAAIESAQQQPSSGPTLHLISTWGDAYRPEVSLHISNSNNTHGNGDGPSDFGALNSLLGVTAYTASVYMTARPLCSYTLEYDNTQENITAITFLVRCPRTFHSIICILRIRISDLSSVALLSCTLPDELAELRTLCTSNTSLLRATPLGLLSLILDQRSRSWERWVTQVWIESNQIEGLTRLAPADWLMNRLPPARSRELAADPDKLLEQLRSTDVQICHGQNVMAFAARYAAFCFESVALVERARAGGGVRLKPAARAMFEDRIRFMQSRCCSVQERFAEMRERHRGQINVMFSLIAQKDSKVNRAVAGLNLDVARVAAVDSRTMKTIGVLTLVFLPSTLVTVSTPFVSINPQFPWSKWGI
ncbi:hypothetical protein B0T26DRAFT_710053 [Lasiosphaeria miniovina]|uniref:Uncharacterized protein n=1 Tax=Lasiosphaeria miniovina TaxID=1954250 RepID=A0AA40AKL2_9PEZI|nr:uncharacterized protein B0T26DRAFT_710053 [Lasiosphaeria miniovina]KAK0717495.1 hypothetical protein B0T26DRAFT_710053 [Lasiosphaeria miniovina]